MVTLLQAHCTSLSRDPTLWRGSFYMLVLSLIHIFFLCDGWQNLATCLHKVSRDAEKVRYRIHCNDFDGF